LQLLYEFKFNNNGLGQYSSRIAGNFFGEGDKEIPVLINATDFNRS